MANGEILIDGDVTFMGGQDDYRRPDQLRPGQFASGVNISIGRGGVSGRPGFNFKKLKFPPGGITNIYRYTRTWESIFKSGKFQALLPYRTGSQDFLIAIIGGYFFRINPLTLVVDVLNVDGKPRVSQFASRVQWSPAGDYTVIFSYPDYPILITGETVRYANPNNVINGKPAPEVPVSVIGTFNSDRLFVANAANQFTGGDPVGLQGDVNPPITFAEVLNPSAPYADQTGFSLGTQYGNEPITAMGFLQQVDGSTEIGPMFVATAKSIFTYRTNTPRGSWTDGTGGTFGSIFVAGAGIVGPQAFANVNSDLFFLSQNGELRSASTSRDDQGRWSRVPISREVSQFLKYNDPTLAQYAFVRYWRNRLFVSANPYRFKAISNDQNYIADYASAGMVVLNMDNVSSVSQRNPPAWEGLYTGIRPMDMCVTGMDQLFIIGKDENNQTALCEVVEDQTYDIDQYGQKRQFRSRLQSREYDWKDPIGLKVEHSIVLGLQDLSGDVSVNVKRKASQSSIWVNWNTWNHKAPTTQCSGSPLFPNGLASHSMRSVDIRGPENGNPGCSLPSGVPLTEIRKEQYQIDIKADNFTLQDFFSRVVKSSNRDNAADCGPAKPGIEVAAVCDDTWKV